MSEDVFNIESLALEIDRDGNTFYIHEEDKPFEEPLKVFAVEADEEEDPDQGWGETEHFDEVEKPSATGVPTPKLLPTPKRPDDAET